MHVCVCIKGRTQTCATCAAAGPAKRNGNKNAKHTHRQTVEHMYVCVLAPSCISFARERDEAEKIKRIKYKNGNNNNNSKQKLKPKRAEQNIMARRVARWLRRTDRETDGQTYLRSNVNPFAVPLSASPFPLPLLAHTHFYMGATRTPM